MPTFKKSSRILEVHEGGKLHRLVITHPAMPGRLNIDLAKPGELNSNDAFAFERGRSLTNHGIWYDLHEALMAYGLEDRHAESICDAWDARGAGLSVWFDVPPIAV